ncbi:uncharacterized protein LY79DRAFT_247954 [Colletotrichum navitas]|uniref:Uncharacterized protein n=1 Tax=Colletotrichum navitas TaxID=681940 RepID=A0AAD8Q9P5_9PEZI|nr:uncharacterized protein LY79DRAFT_247954 [Colletotrichum navitas]KAK1598560.1 hypothetical protein LY79DRAFT_247954 [Colletotrichum navitas]
MIVLNVAVPLSTHATLLLFALIDIQPLRCPSSSAHTCRGRLSAGSRPWAVTSFLSMHDLGVHRSNNSAFTVKHDRAMAASYFAETRCLQQDACLPASYAPPPRYHTATLFHPRFFLFPAPRIRTTPELYTTQYPYGYTGRVHLLSWGAGLSKGLAQPSAAAYLLPSQALKRKQTCVSRLLTFMAFLRLQSIRQVSRHQNEAVDYHPFHSSPQRTEPSPPFLLLVPGGPAWFGPPMDGSSSLLAHRCLCLDW